MSFGTPKWERQTQPWKQLVGCTTSESGIERDDRKTEGSLFLIKSNICVHSPAALDIAAENAVAIARTLRPTTGRYFYWGDDGKPWCRCPQCKGLSDSDQATLLRTTC
jgi:hypothetical protein